MLKRIAMTAWVMMILAAAALAETYAYSNEVMSNIHYECEDIDGVLSAAFEGAYAGMLRTGDEILCGTMRTTYYHSEPGIVQSKTALLAVRREGKVLLIGAGQKDGRWNRVVETDSFFRQDQKFDLTVLPEHDRLDRFRGAGIVMTVDGEEFHVAVQESGCIYLNGYRIAQQDGTVYSLEVESGRLEAFVRQGENTRSSMENWGIVPSRLCSWRYDSVPASIAQAEAFVRLNPVVLDEDEAYIFGVNFRKRPTGESDSMGRYTARVRVLGREEGLNYPWYNVDVGGTQGWVSGVYVLFWGDEKRRLGLCGYASEVYDVAVTEKDTALVSQPGGNGKHMLSAGTMMHVLEENEGWLHVIVPRGSITWKTDWDGEYGFVQKSSVTIGKSIADVRWK